RLSRLAMLAVGAVSVAATVFILAGGPRRSTAQVAALAALRQRPGTVTQTTPAPPTPAPTAVTHASAAPASSSAGSGPPAGGSSAPSPPATSAPSSAPATASTPPTSTTTPSTTTSSSSTAGPSSKLPKVRHVFEIVLSTTSYDAAFGHGSPATYLR